MKLACLICALACAGCGVLTQPAPEVAPAPVAVAVAPAEVPKPAVKAAPALPPVKKSAATPSPPAKKEAATAVAPTKVDAGPHLDLKGLEARLKETSAIGTFTKLSLKNSVDDLLGNFRAYHAGKTASTAPLRQQYELLMMKVLSLLQNDDPRLADEIARSREAIWGVLTDKVRFSTI